MNQQNIKTQNARKIHKTLQLKELQNLKMCVNYTTVTSLKLQ